MKNSKTEAQIDQEFRERQIDQEFDEMIIRVLGKEALDDQTPIPDWDNRPFGDMLYYQDPGDIVAIVYHERTPEEELMVPIFALRAVESVMKRVASSEE